jgi:hypothetical protein
MRITARFLVTIGALATAYYALVGMVRGYLPSAAVVPTWWFHAWPSKYAAVISWVSVLDATAALAGAVPISLLIVLFVKDRYRVAFAVGGLIAAVVLVGTFIEFPPSSDATVWWLITVVQSGALLGSPPLLVWVGHRLPSNNRVWTPPSSGNR